MGTYVNPPIQLWTDSYLSSLASEAEIQISTEVPCIYVRFPLNIKQGQSIYTFADTTGVQLPLGPQRLTGIIRITYQSWTVHPVFQNQLRNVVIPLRPEEGEVQSSRPFMYMRNGYGMDGIKLYPAPSANITYDNSDVTTQNSIVANVIVSGWRIADPTGVTYRIPFYIQQTLVRYYVMERAYRKEGRGQNLDASKYYAAKYSKLMTRFKTITSQLFASRTHGMGDQFLSIYGRKPPHPKLPTNFPDNGQW
jgi:hypothetical protein